MTAAPAHAAVDADEEWDSPWPRRLLVALIFVVAEMAMVRRTPAQLAHSIPGNLGDPAFVVWTLRWDAHALLHQLVPAHPLSIFDANIFWPAHHSLAYADDLLSVAPVYNALYFLSHNWALSLNLMWLGELGLNMGATYSLTRWLTGRTEAAIFAGLACGFSAFIIADVSHPQLQLVGLIPLGLLLLFKLLDRPRLGLAVGLGVVNLMILLSVGYWAAIYIVAVVVVLLGWLIAVRGHFGRRVIIALAVAGGITLLAAPTFLPYRQVQQAVGTRPLAPVWSLHPHDILRPAARSYLYAGLAVDDAFGTGERHLFPGFLTMALAGLGAVALALAFRRRAKNGGALVVRHPPPDWRAPPGRGVFAVLLMAVGLTALVLAIGSPHNLWTPWRVLHDFVPGFAGVRVTARLAAVTLLAGAVLAGFGLDAVLRRLRHRGMGLAVTAVACIVVLVELAAPVPWTTLPSDTATLAAYRALSHRPPGAVVELPIADPFTATETWSLTEPTRMVWSTIDWHPRLNGYSGAEPTTYSRDATSLATLPAPAGQATLRERHIRYLVLHVGMQVGYQMLTQSQADAILAGLPGQLSATRYGPNYLVDLGPR